MSCPFDSDVQYSADVLALFDITMTYTVMDGTVKEAKTDKDCKFYVKDKYTKLPVAVKYEVKAVKKATYEEYKASKEMFDFYLKAPGAKANWVTKDGETAISYSSPTFFDAKGIKSVVFNR